MRVICVDDERPALENFKMTVAKYADIEDLQLFQRGDLALEWAQNNKVDAAFLDMEMPERRGIELAKELKDIDQNISIVFVTAFSQYALEAFGVDAIGYVMKPYTAAEIRRELDKVLQQKPVPKSRVEIETIPDFVFKVDGHPITFGPKVEELLALLVDRAEAGVSVGDAISAMWPDRPSDDTSRSLYRNTSKRLIDTMADLKLSDVIVTDGRKRYINRKKVNCDLYRILDGDMEPMNHYSGEYMRRWGWAEDRNAWLYDLYYGEN